MNRIKICPILMAEKPHLAAAAHFPEPERSELMLPILCVMQECAIYDDLTKRCSLCVNKKEESQDGSQ